MTTPGMTNVYKLRYPVKGEPINKTRAMLEENAKSIEAALLAKGVPATGAADLAAVSGRVSPLEYDTGWVAGATAASPATTWSIAGTLVRRQGKVLSIAGSAAKASWAAGETVMTLQPQYRPTVTVELLVRVGSAYFGAQVLPSGVVSMYTAGTGAFAYVASQGIPL